VQRDEQAADVLREERKEAAQSEYLKWAEQRVRQVQLSRLCCATLNGLYCAVPHCTDYTVLYHTAWTLLCCTTLYGLYCAVPHCMNSTVLYHTV